jgi:hypothetical protein
MLCLYAYCELLYAYMLIYDHYFKCYAYMLIYSSYVWLYASIYVINLYTSMFMLQCFTHSYVMILLCYVKGSNPNT